MAKKDTTHKAVQVKVSKEELNHTTITEAQLKKIKATHYTLEEFAAIHYPGKSLKQVRRYIRRFRVTAPIKVQNNWFIPKDRPIYL